MTSRGADRSGRTVWCVGLLVAVIFLLPPLVRATGHRLFAPDSSSSFRLNRGFDKPESKQTLTPPLTESHERAARADRMMAPPEFAQRVAVVETLAPQHSPTVDPQRGPPSRLIS